MSNALVTVILVTIFSAGSAVAALTVRSVDIVDGEVKTVDLANGAVTNVKLAANAVTGAKVDESTLGIVPNANLLDGKDSTAFVTGPGRFLSDESSFSWGDGVYLFDTTRASQVGFNVAARCADSSFDFNNWMSTPWDVWIRIDGGDPVFGQAGPAGTYPNDSVIATSGTPPPHVTTFHAVHPATGRQVFVEVTVRGIPPPGDDGFGDCFTYATAVLNY
jgi:hypothetical protein